MYEQRIIFPSSVSYRAGLQEAKQLLEQGQQQRLDVKETLLETIAVLGQRTHSPSAQLLALAVLVGRLDDLDPGIRSFAAQLLLGESAVRHIRSDCPAVFGWVCCVHSRLSAAQLLLGRVCCAHIRLSAAQLLFG